MKNHDPLISRPNLRNQNGELFTVKGLFWTGNCSLRSHTLTYFTATCCACAQHASAEGSLSLVCNVTSECWIKSISRAMTSCWDATQPHCEEALCRMSCNSRLIHSLYRCFRGHHVPDQSRQNRDDPWRVTLNLTGWHNGKTVSIEACSATACGKMS